MSHKKTINGNNPDYNWTVLRFRNRETDEVDDKYRIEVLGYRKNFDGENKPSCIRLYADGEVIFEGRYGDLVDIVNKSKQTENNF